MPDVPILFAKFPSAVIGTGEPIVIPAASSRIDYEAELAIVIGRTAHGVTADRAAGVILGFTAANDVSARDLQKRDGQWVRSKSIDTFGPLGPAIVTADEIGDANALGIRCRVNGRTLQDSSTREFVFRVEELVAFISDTITLEPGDVILTGTPPGVGYARSPAILSRARRCRRGRYRRHRRAPQPGAVVAATSTDRFRVAGAASIR